MGIKETQIYRYLFETKKNTFYCERILSVISDVQPLLNRIPVMFSNYTNHDIGHSARVADYMVDLLPLPIENYNDTELVIMLFSAIFHDIGMAVSETENKLKPSEQNEIRKIHHIRSEDYLNTQYNYYTNIINESTYDIYSTIIQDISKYTPKLEIEETIETEKMKNYITQYIDYKNETQYSDNKNNYHTIPNTYIRKKTIAASICHPVGWLFERSIDYLLSYYLELNMILE